MKNKIKNKRFLISCCLSLLVVISSIYSYKIISAELKSKNETKKETTKEVIEKDTKKEKEKNKKQNESKEDDSSTSKEKTEEVKQTDGTISLGTYKLTAYCACSKCCGKWASGYTASGTLATQGRTVAAGNNLPFGTKLLINGNVYTVEDRGVGNGTIDIFFNSHQEALKFGVKYAEVFKYIY